MKNQTQTWGYLEVLIEGSVETSYAFFETTEGGQKYAYARVKKAGQKVHRALHGIVVDEKLQVLEVYNVDTKRWEKPKNETNRFSV
jgi:hypothetical protein